MDITGSHLFGCTEMSPGLDGWRQECCSSSNRGLMQPYRSRSRSPPCVSGLRKGVTKERASAQGDGTSAKADKIDTRDSVKAVRNFKFRLIEYLKDLIKPHWKERKISKNDHKMIIKRSVTKVIESFGSSGIPHSEEKIDEYLGLSKSKLSKLVQAYVKKYQKASRKLEQLFSVNFTGGEHCLRVHLTGKKFRSGKPCSPFMISHLVAVFVYACFIYKKVERQKLGRLSHLIKSYVQGVLHVKENGAKNGLENCPK
ncbi:hypothetical protein BUALT_Bualt04G0051600 [Buddleja alternifolia]|uniref:SFR19-like C-terminal domain-containing protein n=1 Tax=Buddleja alternifolia TaxID=168488 RepID=A0AAV6XNG6_9LAMI|nr:hypothetical protein BUALT_Bualt04G0051600 [Buddleja alternifolia]